MIVFEEHRPDCYMEHKAALVYGGNVDLHSESTRLKELSYELEPVPTYIVELYYSCIQKAETQVELLNALYHMSNNNINIVGSRNYVYSSFRQGCILEDFTIDRSNRITRGMGLREKAFYLFWEGV